MRFAYEEKNAQQKQEIFDYNVEYYISDVITFSILLRIS